MVEQRKIIHILLATWGYPEPGVKGNPFIASRARALVKYGCKVTVLNVRFSNPLNWLANYRKYEKLKTEESKYGVNVLYIPCINFFPSALTRSAISSIQKKLFFFITKNRLKSYMSKNGVPDVLHHHYITNGTPYISDFIARYFKIPYVISEHSSFSMRASHLESKAFLTRKATPFFSAEEMVQFVKNAKVCSAKIQRFADLCSQMFGRKFIAITNPVPPFFSEVKLPEFPKSFQNGFFFIAVGDLRPNKCHIRLLKAFAKLHEKHEKVFLRIIGEGPMRKEIEKEIESLNLSDHVELLGYLPQTKVLEFMDKSHVLTVSSNREVVNSTMVEGWFRGLPTVSTDCGAHKDIVTPLNGLLCEKNEIDLGEKMLKILDNYHQFNPSQIIEEARRNYSETEVVKDLKNAYQIALSQVNS